MYNQFENYIGNYFIIEKPEKNTSRIKLLQLRIIKKSLRWMRVFLKPERTIYYPSGIIIYSIQLIKQISRSPGRSLVR